MAIDSFEAAAVQGNDFRQAARSLYPGDLPCLLLGCVRLTGYSWGAIGCFKDALWVVHLIPHNTGLLLRAACRQ